MIRVCLFFGKSEVCWQGSRVLRYGISNSIWNGETYLKDKQREAVQTFLQGIDTVVALPTGYGKSVIFATLPYVFDSLRGNALTVCNLADYKLFNLLCNNVNSYFI